MSIRPTSRRPPSRREGLLQPAMAVGEHPGAMPKDGPWGNGKRGGGCLPRCNPQGAQPCLERLLAPGLPTRCPVLADAYALRMRGTAPDGRIGMVGRTSRNAIPEFVQDKKAHRHAAPCTPAGPWRIVPDRPPTWRQALAHPRGLIGLSACASRLLRPVVQATAGTAIARGVPDGAKQPCDPSLHGSGNHTPPICPCSTPRDTRASGQSAAQGTRGHQLPSPLPTGSRRFRYDRTPCDGTASDTLSDATASLTCST
ncbi:UNVERIFIED_ORG: hypothetical protein HNP28_000793 [Comamonas terrigena]